MRRRHMESRVFGPQLRAQSFAYRRLASGARLAATRRPRRTWTRTRTRRWSCQNSYFGCCCIALAVVHLFGVGFSWFFAQVVQVGRDQEEQEEEGETKVNLW